MHAEYNYESFRIKDEKGGANMVSEVHVLETMVMTGVNQGCDCADPCTGSENCNCEDF